MRQRIRGVGSGHGARHIYAGGGDWLRGRQGEEYGGFCGGGVEVVEGRLER